ncbi:GtrA family protein [Nocardia salmonicida]|uniref:GtrA family protein n=1 Tax=Nocardia salmonicida TaxID=53431 RepID=UPI0007A48B1A|nr:GtrA family protein [Nocardia salmonicida]
MNSTAFAEPAISSSPVASSGAGRVRASLRSDHPLAQLIRFALVGGASNVAYVLVFLAFDGFDPLATNVLGSIVSTMIANELHRRLTFRASGTVGWFTAQCQGGTLALLGLLFTTATLAALEFTAPGLGHLPQAAAVLVTMATVGGMRFLALRSMVF